MIEDDHIRNDGWIEKSDVRAQMKRHKCVTEKDRDGVFFCLVSRVGRIKSSEFQRTVTSISLMMYDLNWNHFPLFVNKITIIQIEETLYFLLCQWCERKWRVGKKLRKQCVKYSMIKKNFFKWMLCIKLEEAQKNIKFVDDKKSIRSAYHMRVVIGWSQSQLELVGSPVGHRADIHTHDKKWKSYWQKN